MDVFVEVCSACAVLWLLHGWWQQLLVGSTPCADWPCSCLLIASSSSCAACHFFFRASWRCLGMRTFSSEVALFQLCTHPLPTSFLMSSAFWKRSVPSECNKYPFALIHKPHAVVLGSSIITPASNEKKAMWGCAMNKCNRVRIIQKWYELLCGHSACKWPYRCLWAQCCHH